MQHQNAYVLRTRAWSESSWIVDMFSENHGRVAGIAKGARRLKSRTRPHLMPFRPLEVGWTGKGELPIVTAVDAVGKPSPLSGERLLCGWYMNELLLRLLARSDAYPRLFRLYAKAIDAMATDESPDIILRWFELKLLEQTGYGLVLDAEISTGAMIESDQRYRYLVDRGPVFPNEVTDDGNSVEGTGATMADYRQGLDVSGESLLSIAQGDLSSREVRADAKALLRAVIDRQLDGRPLRTPRMLRALRARARVA